MAHAEVTKRKNRAGEGSIDRLAIMLSGLCLVHCLATTLLLTVLASAGGMLLHPLIHEVGLALAICLAAIALGRGWLRHRARLPAMVGGGGLALMATALMAPHGLAEATVTIAGVALVALGHNLNRRALR